MTTEPTLTFMDVYNNRPRIRPGGDDMLETRKQHFIDFNKWKRDLFSAMRKDINVMISVYGQNCTRPPFHKNFKHEDWDPEWKKYIENPENKKKPEVCNFLKGKKRNDSRKTRKGAQSLSGDNDSSTSVTDEDDNTGKLASCRKNGTPRRGGRKKKSASNTPRGGNGTPRSLSSMM